MMLRGKWLVAGLLMAAAPLAGCRDNPDAKAELKPIDDGLTDADPARLIAAGLPEASASALRAWMEQPGHPQLLLEGETAIASPTATAPLLMRPI